MIFVDRSDPFIDPSTQPFIDSSILPLVVLVLFFRSRNVLATTLVVFQTLHRRSHRSHPALVEDDVGERRPLELIRGLNRVSQ
jgi:hypothetical protein